MNEWMNGRRAETVEWQDDMSLFLYLYFYIAEVVSLLKATVLFIFVLPTNSRHLAFCHSNLWQTDFIPITSGKEIPMWKWLSSHKKYLTAWL